MSRALFDEKFGDALVPGAPTSPGVYRYASADGVVIYVGKAKNLRRRLSNYRNATRKKGHRKLRTLVREADSLVYELCETEEAALLRENELIGELKPAYNVDGAFAFLYPSLGVGQWDKHTLLCFTTQPEQFEPLGLTWYGCFRSRPRAKLAFEALISLLLFVAHREKTTRLLTTFKLSQSAKITATVETGKGVVVRVIKRGQLAAGNRSLSWNGRVGAGGLAYGGAYQVHVVAANELGRVDLYAPFRARR